MFDKSTKPPHDGKNLNIQILRAIAIIMVVMQHYKIRMPTESWYLEMFRYIQLWPGVDIFLAISGYLMCKSLKNQSSGKGDFVKHLKSFLLKRFFRLYPVLMVWGTLTVLACFFTAERFYTNPLSEFKTFLTSLMAVSNIYLHHCVTNGYICSNGSGGVTWSLSLEWQLYFLIALIYIPLSRNINILAFIFTIICILSIFIPAAEPQNMAYAWWIRPIPFFIGAIIYLYNDKKIPINPLLSKLLFLIFFITLIASPLLVATQFVSLSIGLSGAFLFYIFLNNITIKRSLITHILNWLGDRSYSIYLCHIPVMLILATFYEYISKTLNMHLGYLTLLIAYIGTMLSSAHITYELVEKKGIAIRLKLNNIKKRA